MEAPRGRLFEFALLVTLGSVRMFIQSRNSDHGK
jgi:hypothetical protein